MFQVSAVTFIVQCVGPTYMNRDAEYERVKHRCIGVQVCTGAYSSLGAVGAVKRTLLAQ